MKTSLFTPARLVAAAAGVVASTWMPELDDDVHPVARFGSTMAAIEHRRHRNSRLAGVEYAAAGVGLGLLAGRVATSTAGRSAGGIAATAVCVAGAQLRSVARDIGEHLAGGDLDRARAALPALVGRDTSGLDASGISAAAIESVAENMVDAVFAPAWWAAIGGAPGVAAYRAVNTMDAMVGRHDDRYEHFGWAAARTDDVANLVPARLFALAVAATRPDRARAVFATVRADARWHPSPNAGVAEAAMAGALGCSLGGPLRYGDVDEDRPVLGSGPRPGPAQLAEALAIAERTEHLLVGVLLATAASRLLRALR